MKEKTHFLGFSRFESNPKYSGVTPAATRATCSSRVQELAAPPSRYKNYQYELPIPRSVPESALKYQPTPRVNELAVPKKLPGVL